MAYIGLDPSKPVPENQLKWLNWMFPNGWSFTKGTTEYIESQLGNNANALDSFGPWPPPPFDPKEPDGLYGGWPFSPSLIQSGQVLPQWVKLSFGAGQSDTREEISLLAGPFLGNMADKMPNLTSLALTPVKSPGDPRIYAAISEWNKATPDERAAFKKLSFTSQYADRPPPWMTVTGYGMVGWVNQLISVVNNNLSKPGFYVSGDPRDPDFELGVGVLEGFTKHPQVLHLNKLTPIQLVAPTMRIRSAGATLKAQGKARRRKSVARDLAIKIGDARAASQLEQEIEAMDRDRVDPRGLDLAVEEAEPERLVESDIADQEGLNEDALLEVDEDVHVASTGPATAGTMPGVGPLAAATIGFFAAGPPGAIGGYLIGMATQKKKGNA